jgi:hypothetical protein
MGALVAAPLAGGPWKNEQPNVGNSRSRATASAISLEDRRT